MYKLVQIDDKPVLKRSEDRIKLINPGFQATYRILQEGMNEADVTCLRGDSLSSLIESGQTITLRDEQDRFKCKTFAAGTYTARMLQQDAIRDGVRVAPVHSLPEKKAFFDQTLHQFSPSERRLINPHYYKVDISDDLYDVKTGILDRLNQEIADFKI